MGGTLEEIYYDRATWEGAIRGLQELLARYDLDPGLSLPELQDTVLAGMEAYQRWREASLIELPPERVWTEYIFSDHGLLRARIAAAAEDLTLFYENTFMARRLRPEAPAVVAELHARAYRLGVISNVISRRQVPHNLATYGLDRYFDVMVTSAMAGRRKPDPRIFLKAADRLGVPPAACAFVGDTVSRDVVGARRASYGLVIQIKSFLTDRSDRGAYVEAPDAVITDLREVFPLLTRHDSVAL